MLQDFYVEVWVVDLHDMNQRFRFLDFFVSALEAFFLSICIADYIYILSAFSIRYEFNHGGGDKGVSVVWRS